MDQAFSGPDPGCQTKTTGYVMTRWPFVDPFLDLKEEQKRLIIEAEVVASTLHENIAFVVLGSPDNYVKRLCEKYVAGPPGI